jgi:lipopolysaccharide export LptBFGC system permease protein LptF
MRLGAKGQISPWLAAWLPDIVFGTFGIASFTAFLTRQWPKTTIEADGKS